MESSVAVAYDESPRAVKLCGELLSWMQRTGTSVKATAVIAGIHQTSLSQFIESPSKRGDYNLLSAIEALLGRFRHSEDLRADPVCTTSIFDDAWEVLQFCVEGLQMGAIFAFSGTGKTTIANEFRRQHRDTIFITAHIRKRSAGAILSMIAERLGCRYWGEQANSICMDELIKRLYDWPRPLIIDEAHFLKWETFEALRTIYDAVPLGIVYLGQPRLYDEMRGRKNRYLYDQIFSRIAITRRLGDVIPREDVAAISKLLCPGIDKKCVDFLHKKAQGEGKLRTMTNLLRLAVKMSEARDNIITLGLLKQANQFLMG